VKISVSMLYNKYWGARAGCTFQVLAAGEQNQITYPYLI
jgi:hypothetical protein